MTHNYLQSMSEFEILVVLAVFVATYISLRIAFIEFVLLKPKEANLFFGTVSLVVANVISWHCAITGSL